MGREDWYRNTTWTKNVRKAFFTRLKRSRKSYNKAQYLRIQAVYLSESGQKKHIRSALQLLDLMVEKCPEPSQLAAAYLQQAQCYEQLGKYQAAIDSYRHSIDAEREHGATVWAALHFGWFTVKRKLLKHYDEVLSLLSKPSEVFLLLPVNQFKYASIFSIILDHKAEVQPAKRFARMAFEAMGKDESQFRYYRKIGLVTNPDKKIVRALKRILGK